MSALEIDGSRGEGGGQILRTSLALSMITGRPMAMRRIRAGRAKPGLRRQHLACVEAAAQLSGARTRGAEVGSQVLEFEPAPMASWPSHDLVIDIGSAGSTTLVVQTILVPAIVAAPSRAHPKGTGSPDSSLAKETARAFRAVITGGTHNPMAPPFEFLERVFAPHLTAMGANVSITCERPGFVPNGGGKLVVEVGGGKPLRPVEIVEADAIVARRATAIVCALPTHVAERELGIVRARLGFTADECEIRPIAQGSQANVLLIEVERASGVRELVTGFGEKSTRAELIAERACDELAAYLATGMPVGEHLADQLLLPMAVAGGGMFRASPLTLHSTTNIESIRAFLDVPITVTEVAGGVLVRVG